MANVVKGVMLQIRNNSLVIPCDSKTKSPKCKWDEAQRGYDKQTHGITYGLLTGKQNDIIAVDLDSYKWKDTEAHPWIEKFGKNYVKKINTLTVKTVSGGHHLIFKYRDDLPTIAGQHEIDIRADGGYIIGAGSYINKNGKRGYYRAVNNVLPIEMSDDIADFLKATVYKTNPDQAKDNKQRNADNNQFYYRLPLSDIVDICDVIAEQKPQMLDDRNPWHTFTAFMVHQTQFHDEEIIREFWDTYSKKCEERYDSEHNMRIWNQKLKNVPETGAACEILLNSVGWSAAISYYKYFPYSEKRTKADIKINCARLANESFDGCPYTDWSGDDQSHLIVKSDMGTGKTHSIISYLINNNERCISITNRECLADNHVRDFNEKLADYPDMQFQHYKHGFTLLEGANLVIQLDSIDKIQNWDFSEYCVFLDEIASLIKYLHTSPTFAKKSHTITELFKKILTECKQIIGVDAHIDAGVWLYLDNIGIANRVFVENEYKNFADIECHELELFDDLINAASVLDSYAIFTDSAKEAKIISELLNEIHDGEGELCECITADSDNIPDLDTVARFVASPKITRGVDSQMKRNVFCYYKSHTIGASDMAQQIGRVRNPIAVYYCFGGKKAQFKKDKKTNVFEKLRDGLVKKPLFTDREAVKLYNQLIYNNSHGVMHIDDFRSESDRDIYAASWQYYVYRDVCESSNKLYYLKQYLRNSGYNVITPPYLYLDSTPFNNNKYDDYYTAWCDRHWTGDLNKLEQWQKRIIRILQIDTNQELANVKSLIFDKQKLRQHFNITKFQFVDSDLSNAQTQTPKELLITSDRMKIEYIKKFITLCNGNVDKFDIDSVDNVAIKLELPDAQHHADIKNGYRTVFSDYHKFNDKILTDRTTLYGFMRKLVKSVFGIPLISQKIQVAGVRTLNYYLHSADLQYHYNIYKFRMRDNGYDDE
jgi:hypothetical protein